MRSLECVGQAFELLRLKGILKHDDLQAFPVQFLQRSSSLFHEGLMLEGHGRGGWLEGPLIWNVDVSLTPILNLCVNLYHPRCMILLRRECFQHQFLKGEGGSLGGEGCYHVSAGTGEGPWALMKLRQIFNQPFGSAHMSGSLHLSGATGLLLFCGH